jgi:hypothetical protein
MPVSPPGGLALLFNFYGYYLPFMLYAAWAPLALWDLARREDVGRGRGLTWTALVILVPFAGAGAYHVIGGSTLPGWLRHGMVWGGLAAFVLVLAVGASAVL